MQQHQQNDGHDDNDAGCVDQQQQQDDNDDDNWATSSFSQPHQQQPEPELHEQDDTNIDCELRAFAAAAGVAAFAAITRALQTSAMKAADQGLEHHGPDDPIVLACSDIEVYLNDLNSRTTNLTNDANLRALVAAKSAASKAVHAAAGAAQRHKQQCRQTQLDQYNDNNNGTDSGFNRTSSSCTVAFSAAADMVLTATTAASRALDGLDVEATWVAHRSNVAQANESALLRRHQLLLDAGNASDNETSSATNSAPISFGITRMRAARRQPQNTQTNRRAGCLTSAWQATKHAWVRVFVALAYCRCCRC